MRKTKLIVIAGPTAVGKTSLSIHLAKCFNGEVISADSRQVYRDLNIGTEKVTEREMHGVPHHLIDIANPKRAFSVEQYRMYAERAIRDITTRGNVPFLVGGTGFYIDALVYGHTLPPVPPNPAMRKKLEKKTTQELFSMLNRLDPVRARTIEPGNPRRLIRAIEIAKTLGNVPQLKYSSVLEYDVLYIGLTLPLPLLKKQIGIRAERTVRLGLVAETKRLRESGLSWKRLHELGMEYRVVSNYLREDIDKSEMLEQLKREISNYAKRQMRWFKRNKDIEWYSPKETRKIEKRVKEFLTS